jgi:hypothetical protein
MEKNKITTPVVFLIFNRPDTTEKVFEAIRRARPPKLLVVADGPRPDRQGEAEKCAAARELIDRVDWPCEVKTNYSDVNLGCKQRISSGLNWVFETVEEAIILEDDCLPDPTFFLFCQELLAKYRDDERVMSIAGDNFQFGRKVTPYSYYFSGYAHMWGWASWRRSWNNYDVSMKIWPEIRDHSLLRNIFEDSRVMKYWHWVFEIVYKNQIDTWDYQWMFACMVNNGLVILPNKNLVSNLGYGIAAATHTTWNSIFGNMKTESMQFPLSHPPYILRDRKADSFTDKELFVASYFVRAKQKIKLLQRSLGLDK